MQARAIAGAPGIIDSANPGQLSTAGIVGSSFLRILQIGEWSRLLLNPFGLKPNVQLMFENISDGGNNTYIDEINISGTMVGVDEVEEIELGFTLYPNPSSGNTSLQFLLKNDQDVQLTLRDISGRLVNSILNQKLGGGLHEYQIPPHTPWNLLC
ncbi:MAG: T9SS type A sorting domain-containing protein [Saprospiraceae bacterium]|nr:T9SS type A sorting domain-containing protein [Candidatus Brachybacter algidus]